MEMVHTWCEATDKPDTFVRVLLVDYSKDVDHINHESIIAKLCDMGRVGRPASTACKVDGSVPGRPSTLQLVYNSLYMLMLFFL